MSCVICKSLRFRWADFTKCLCRCFIDIRSKLKRPVCCRCSRFCSAICRSRGDRRPRMTRQTQPRQHVITRHQFCPDMAILRVGNPSSSPPGNLSVFENNRKNVEKTEKENMELARVEPATLDMKNTHDSTTELQPLDSSWLALLIISICLRNIQLIFNLEAMKPFLTKTPFQYGQCATPRSGTRKCACCYIACARENYGYCAYAFDLDHIRDLVGVATSLEELWIVHCS